MIQSTSVIIGEKVCRRKQCDFLNPNTAGITSVISIGSDSATIHDVFQTTQFNVARPAALRQGDQRLAATRMSRQLWEDDRKPQKTWVRKRSWISCFHPNLLTLLGKRIRCGDRILSAVSCRWISWPLRFVNSCLSEITDPRVANGLMISKARLTPILLRPGFAWERFL